MTTSEIHAHSLSGEQAAGRTAIKGLRNTLQLNATTSAIGGLAAVAAGGQLNRLLGTSSPGWIRVVGAGLIVFALDVGILSRMSVRRLAQFTPAVSAGDAIWVIASVATILAGWYSIAGVVVVAVVGAMVASFCVRQTVYRRRMLRESNGVG